MEKLPSESPTFTIMANALKYRFIFMIIYPRQKIYGYSFYRHLKGILLKKYNAKDFVIKFLN